MNEQIQQKQETAPLVFRSATDLDIEQLIKIDESVAGAHTYSAMLTPEDWKKEMVASRVYVVEERGIVVGSISYEERGDDGLYISGIIVLPQYQNRGIGRAALERVLKEHANTKRVTLVTHPENPALKLYESLGFEVESRKENYWGEGEPRLLLALTRE